MDSELRSYFWRTKTHVIHMHRLLSALFFAAASSRKLSVAGAVICAGGAAGISAAIRGIRTPFVPSANHRRDID
jgi:hypothetical protein